MSVNFKVYEQKLQILKIEVRKRRKFLDLHCIFSKKLPKTEMPVTMGSLRLLSDL